MIDLINFELPSEQMYLQIEEKIDTNRQNLTFLKSVDDPNFDNLIVPIEKQEHSLSQMWSLASHLQSVKNQESVRQRHQEVQKKISAYYSELGFDKQLMNLFEDVKKNQLSSDQSTVINQSLLNFKLSGVSLEKEKQELLFDLRQQLSELTTKFSENVLDATDKWVLSVEENELTGLNDNQKSYLKQVAQNHNLDSQYAVGLDAPSYIMIMSYCDNRSLREEIYKASASKAGPDDSVSDKYDNTKVAKKILSLRSQIASILGYSNYLEYSLANKFAEHPDDVQAFLDSLIEKVKPHAETEKEELASFIRGCENSPVEIEPWDIGYYVQKLKKKKLDYNEEELREYFPATHVTNKMFSIFGDLYGFTVKKREDISTWDPLVDIYELINTKNNETIGYLYADLYARPKKRGGAWMSDAQSYVNYNNWQEKPIAYLACNFQHSPTPTLTFRDVETLFHEFGHSLHHLLTIRQLPSIAGINEVPWDIVELPSQLQEQWCWDKEMLKKLSKHKDTGDALPSNKIDKIIDSRHFQASSHLIRQLEFASLDWSIHRHQEIDDVVQFWKELREDIAVYPTYKEHVFPLSFSHIFAGGYAAGYYSYLWAETYAHQVYFHMKSQNFSNESAHGFMDSFLAKGGDENLRDSLHDYLGGGQRVEPLLKSYGVVK